MKTNWGILGCGIIAGAFAEGLRSVPGARLAACAARSGERAREFGARFGCRRTYGDYLALARDPGVDIIYVATTHNFHREHARLCLEEGKPVLLEKAFTVNAAEAAEIIRLARRQGLFLMEAMWTRFLPVTCKVRELLVAGLIGEVRSATINFSFTGDWKPEHRLVNRALAGGGLLDVGCYAASYASMVMGGAPRRVHSTACLGPTGVDEHSAALLDYGGGRSALLTNGVRLRGFHDAVLLGTRGALRIPDFWHAREAFLHPNGAKWNSPRRIAPPLRGNGYNYQAVEAAKCLHAGATESQIMPLDESLSVMKTLDAIRAPWGLKYPGEK